MTRSTNMEHVEVLRHMKETIKAIMPSEVAALDAAIASLSAPQPPAEAQPVDRARTLDAARFRAACYALKEKVEGAGCERWAAPDGSRLKDTPEWVAFYNHVSNMHERGGPPPSAPVGMDAAAVEAGHITFESMKQCADSWLAVVDTLNTVAPGWSEKEGTGRECATTTIAALAQQPAAHPAITHCDNCGCDWLDNGLNPAACPYCKQPAAVDEATYTTEEVAEAMEVLRGRHGSTALHDEVLDDMERVLTAALAAQQGACMDCAYNTPQLCDTHGGHGPLDGVTARPGGSDNE